MQVTKEITFDMAHLLSNYNGKCRNLHGHTYRLQVTVEIEVNDISCMAVDFGFLKEVLQKILGTNDIIVVIEGEHSCMTVRGVKSRGAKTKTATIRGAFQANAILRNEFYNLIGGK